MEEEKKYNIISAGKYIFMRNMTWEQAHDALWESRRMYPEGSFEIVPVEECGDKYI